MLGNVVGDDVEHGVETGDPKDLQHAWCESGEPQRAARHPLTFERADQHSEPCRVNEAEIAHVNDDIQVALRAQLAQDIAQLGGGVSVEFAADVRNRGRALGLHRNGQVHRVAFILALPAFSADVNASSLTDGTAAVDPSPDLAGALLALADDFVGLGRVALQIADEKDLLAAVAHMSQARIQGASWVSVTTLRGGEFRTAASTDPRAVTADTIQYAAGSGPCVDAIIDENDVLVRDLRTDPRWPTFGHRVADELGVRSMMAFRLTLEEKDTIAALNVFSLDVDAFDGEALATGRLMATYGALGLNSVADRQRAESLQQALGSAREIGIAIGVLMASQKLTRDRAFEVLRSHSQQHNRKLRDIAAVVAETGALPAYSD